jgi:hypothetical protein
LLFRLISRRVVAEKIHFRNEKSKKKHTVASSVKRVSTKSSKASLVVEEERKSEYKRQRSRRE